MNPVGQLDVRSKEEAGQKNIREILSRRSDLSSFLVHLTRNANGKSAKENLFSILKDWKIEARTMFGAAMSKLNGQIVESQKCVCFTETPLEYLHLLLERIEGRDFRFGPYGVGITKKLARKQGANPVWYLDITPGHDWLMNPINEMIDEGVKSAGFEQTRIAKITPFIEQMGTGRDYRKEFWWEREWRCVGDFYLPSHVIIICLEGDIAQINGLLDPRSSRSASFIDPYWGLEKIISRLAGFDDDEIDIL